MYVKKLCQGPEDANRSCDALPIRPIGVFGGYAYDGSESTVFGKVTIILGTKKYRSKDNLVGDTPSLMSACLLMMNAQSSC